MKAIAIKKAGSASSLKVIDLPQKEPNSNEVVIKQTFAGVNYGDIIRRKRGLFELNEYGYFIPGFEGVGEVISIGSDVKNYKVGDKVGYLNELCGGYSQIVYINEKFVFKVNDQLSDETLAVMTCVGTTALNLVKLSKVEKDDWVLVHGATGGVGLLLVQLCLLKGAKVIAIVGTKEKEKFIKRYSPTVVINRSENDVISKIKSTTGNRKVDIIFDCVGKSVVETNFECIRQGGTILYYGSTSGHSEFPGMQVLMNSITVQGFNIFNFIKNNNWKDSVQELMSLLSDKKIEIYINKVFTMSKAFEAHELLENKLSIGKLAIDLR